MDMYRDFCLRFSEILATPGASSPAVRRIKHGSIHDWPVTVEFLPSITATNSARGNRTAADSNFDSALFNFPITRLGTTLRSATSATATSSRTANTSSDSRQLQFDAKLTPIR